jgi:transposase, IS30 family
VLTDKVSVCRRTENGSAMPGYAHLTTAERDRIAELKADGASLWAIVRELGRAASTISRELRRNALDSGAYRPQVSDGGLHAAPAACGVGDGCLAMSRTPEGWTRADCRTAAARDRDRPAGGLPETIYGWIYRAGQKAERLWRFLTRRRARRRKANARISRDRIAEKTHISAIWRRRGARDGGALGGGPRHLQTRPVRCWCCTSARPGSP